MNCTWTNQMHHMTVMTQTLPLQTQSCFISKFSQLHCVLNVSILIYHVTQYIYRNWRHVRAFLSNAQEGCMQVALSNHTKTDTKQTRVLNRGRDSYNFPSYICVTMSPTRHFFSLRIRWNRDNSEPLHKDSPVNVSRYGKTGEHGSWPE